MLERLDMSRCYAVLSGVFTAVLYALVFFKPTLNTVWGEGSVACGFFVRFVCVEYVRCAIFVQVRVHGLIG